MYAFQTLSKMYYTSYPEGLACDLTLLGVTAGGGGSVGRTVWKYTFFE